MAGVGAITLVVAMSGCGQNGDKAAETVTATVTTSVTAAPAPGSPGAPAPGSPGAPGPTTTGTEGLPVAAAQAALRTAGGSVPNGRPYDMQVETRDGQRVFEVDVASEGAEFEVVVDAAGTRVINSTKQNRPDDDAARAESAAVDAARALQTAADRERDTSFDGLEFDTDGGMTVWKVELVRADGSEVDIRVDAQDGSIR